MTRRLAVAAMAAAVGLRAFATTVYVDAASTGAASPYGSWATASTTIGAAITYATSVATDETPVEIRVKKGTYAENNLSLTAAIGIVGDSGDPADVVVSNVQTADGNSSTVRRTFTLSHAQAKLAALTLAGTGGNNKVAGGHLSMTLGTVSNCVITGGCAYSTASGCNGGNVYMTGGRLVGCRVTDGKNTASTSNSAGRGAGIYASGGTIESCFIARNQCVGQIQAAGLYLDGAVTVANCTVVGNVPSNCGKSLCDIGGIYINNKNALVVNTILYDNGGTLAAEYGGANLARFSHSASTVQNASDAGWQQVLASDFASPALDDYVLLPGAASVDAGTTEGLPSDMSACDLYGHARTSGTAIDIGCGELQQAASGLTVAGTLSTHAAYVASNVTCTARVMGGTANKYKWDFGNGAVVETTEAASTYAFPAYGLFTVKVAASSDGGTTWSAWYSLAQRMLVVPEAVYVDPAGGNPTVPYATKATAATTLAAAFSVLTNEISECSPYFGTVRLCASQSYTEAGTVLNGPVRIVGDTGDPADVVFTHTAAGTHAFELNHADARVEALTVTGLGGATSSTSACGGHVYLTAGTFANCIIENGKLYNNKGGQGANVWMSGGAFEDCIIRGGNNDGATKTPTYAGNVYMAGGRLTRCRILNGTYKGSSSSTTPGRGGGVYSSGGLIENCLFSGNSCSSIAQGGAIYLDGAVTVANCTVVDNAASSGYVGGIYVNNASATVVNTVIFGNGSDAAAEYGTLNLGRFHYCALSVTNESSATSRVITSDAFKDYAAQDYTASVGSRLVDAGTEDASLLPEECSDTDLLQLSRVSGKAIDIGCYEYQEKGVEVGGFVSAYAGFEGVPLTFTAVASVAEGVTYRWDLGNGTSVTTNADSFAYAYPTSGLYAVRVTASTDGGLSWVEWTAVSTKVVVVPETQYVDPAGTNPQYPYRTKATAATTVADVFATMTNSASGGVPVDGGTVILAKGDYTETGIAVSFPIRLIGETGKPADVVFTDATPGKRAFTIGHADAVLAGVTVTGTGWQKEGCAGGHLYLTEGLVTNCVIAGATCAKDSINNNGGGTGVNVWMSGGTIADSVIRGAYNQRGGSGSNGGNVYMAGGRLVRCQILNGRQSGSTGQYRSFKGAGVYASSGVIESCLVMGNVSENVAEGSGLYLDGAVSVVNCTVVGNTPTPFAMPDMPDHTVRYPVGGIQVANAAATVVNTVVYGNGGSVTNEIGVANPGRFVRSASSVANAACADWRVIGATAFRNYAGAADDVRGLKPRAYGPLVGTGLSAAACAEYGATSPTDLLGLTRRADRPFDLGCLAANVGGCALVVQ